MFGERTKVHKQTMLWLLSSLLDIQNIVVKCSNAGGLKRFSYQVIGNPVLRNVYYLLEPVFLAVE